MKIVADISCDIDGPVASTLRPSTIEEPFYGYDANTEKEVEFNNNGSIGIMAVDNLPCELPKDASISFADSFVEHIIPALLGDDPDEIIQRASETTLQGDLTEQFAYLEDYVR